MEESLTKLSKINETLISEIDEIRKKLFEKYFNNSKELCHEESSFFCNISRYMKDKDKEYENLRIKYEKLRSLIFYINQLVKEEV